jgi:hypothetical protein
MQLPRLSAMSAYSRRAYEGRKLTDNLACVPQEFSIENPHQRFSLCSRGRLSTFPSFKTVCKTFKIYDILLQAENAQTKHNFVSKE